jgi:hypothetical protein
MFKSIIETQKLFKVKKIRQDGQVDLKISQYLLSLGNDEQAEVLTAHLSNLKKDLAKLDNPILQGAIGEGGDIQLTQLQLLINVIENLLSQLD